MTWLIPNLYWPMSLVFQLNNLQLNRNQTNNNSNQQQPCPFVLTTICTSSSGSSFWMAITTWPLSLASWVPSTSMITSGVTFLAGADVSDVVSDLLEPLDLGAGWADVDLVVAGWAVWSIRHSYISSSSWEGASSTFACKGTAKSTNKRCDLLNHVAWFSKSQLLFVDLAVPLQAHVEEVSSQDEDEMYKCLMDQTAQSATRSRLLHLPEEAKRRRFAGGGCAVGCVAWSDDEMGLAVVTLVVVVVVDLDLAVVDLGVDVDLLETVDEGAAAAAAAASCRAEIQATWVSEVWGSIRSCRV